MYYWDSSGRLGFKGARKGTPFAASQIGTILGKRNGSDWEFEMLK